ncbi:MAG: hypothetical protein ABIR62_11665 [Dokdonella sp.]|uniref:hypothetical protein n=1 Tax=Dokdonella sp. TaxID=2291710 RepID=UPI003264226D
MNIRIPAIATAVLLACAVTAPNTQAVTITRGFSGLWHDSSGNNRGFSAEVISDGTSNKLLAYWFTRDAAGKPVWLIGEGPIVGNRAVLATVTSESASAATAISWGTLTVAFTDCAHGTVLSTPNDARQPHGQTTIARLASATEVACTGGISDDRTASSDLRIVQFFTNTGVVAAASGRARFDQRSDRSDFNVEVEKLPAGAYDLRVGGSIRATLQVAASATETEVEFRSPAEPGKPLLDFDPRDQTVEILRGTTVLLTTPFGHATPGSGPPSASQQYELRVQTTRNGPKLDAKLRQSTTKSEFNVEIEQVAAGSYVLAVGGVEHGTIVVTAVPGGTEGEIEFRNPAEPAHLALDFDPRGQLVQILSAGTVVISGTFPTTPRASGGQGAGSGNDDPPGDDHGGGSGNDDPPGDDHGGGSGGNDDAPGDDHGGHHGHDDD